MKSFTIVTISYNQISYLKRCVDSVLSQNIIDLQYIVVDAGSTDGSRDLIKSYGESIEAIVESDMGPADGLYKGLSFARNEICGFINSDDYLLPGALQKISQLFHDSEDVQIISGNGIQECLSEGDSKLIIPTEMTYCSLLYRADILFQPSTFFTYDLYRKSDKFSRENKTCWDYELYLSLMATGAKHKVFNNKIAVFNLHQDSITGSGRYAAEHLMEMNRIFIKHTGKKWNVFCFFKMCMKKIKKFLVKKFR